MNLLFELECPQCGGKNELAECDHLLPCAYCGVTNYLLTGDLPRYLLPARDPGAEYLQIPYLRFRGSVFSCTEREITGRIVDLTTLGVPGWRFLPYTLGVRPQALKLRFADPGPAVRLLKNQVSLHEALVKAAKQGGSASREKIFHQALIGETTSLIYLPLFITDHLISDGVTHAPLFNLPAAVDDFLPEMVTEDQSWAPTFLPTLCPTCGWNLTGAKNSVIMGCANCASFWLPTASGFKSIPFATVPGGDHKGLHLPFWRIPVRVDEIALAGFHDFLTLTNQTHLLARSGPDQPLHFYTPAFKIKPDAYLKLSTLLTLGHWQLPPATAAYPSSFFPVTLGPTAAAQSRKLILANAAADKKIILPSLEQLNFQSPAPTLLFLPFIDQGYNFYQSVTALNINRRLLDLSHFL